MGRGKRRQIAPDIYEDDIGRSAIARVKGIKPKEKRFAKTETIETLKKWQDDTRRALRQAARVARADAGTLRADALAYVADLPAGKARNNTRSYLAAWCAELGDRQRATLKAKDLRAVLKGWIERGDAASTIKKRRRALAQLDEALDLDDDDEPRPSRARRLKTPAEPKPKPRGVDMAILDAIIRGMPEVSPARNNGRGGYRFRNKARARLLFFLWTGIAWATQKRLDPRDDVRPDEGIIKLPPREKGAGAEAVTLRLFPEGIEAAREWLRAYAHGKFDTRALGRYFHGAVDRYSKKEAEAGRTVLLPRDLKPYDIRHSFLSWTWWQTKDPFLVQHFAQHADLETTRRYIISKIDAQAEAAIDAYIARRTDGPAVPRVPRVPRAVPRGSSTPPPFGAPERTDRRARLKETLRKS